MAHFSKIDSNNIVVQVDVVDNEIAVSEQAGVNFLRNLYGTNDVWIQTSYNTNGGEHMLGGTPLRKNYGGVGFTYDETKDAFIPPKPYPSWNLNETTCLWEAPVPKPDAETPYQWNEETLSWDARVLE